MKISIYPVGSRRFVTLVNDSEIPIEPYANAFLYDDFLNAEFSTKIRIANELKLVLDYFYSINIKLDTRIASGELLSSSEISRFYGQMMLRKDSFGKQKKIDGFSDVNDKNIRNAISASWHTTAKVTPGTRTGRVRTLRKYLEFLFRHFHEDRATPAAIKISFDMMIAKFKAKESYSTKNKSTNPVELVESAIPDDIYKKFKEILLPSNPLNPFKSSKLRNYLILSILDQAGLRRGEVCKLKISDCQFHDTYNKIKVYRNPDDKSDPRINRPNQKSGRAHISGIEPSLMKQLEFYVKHERNIHQNANNHDFLFVSATNVKNTVGLPISREMVNYMLSRLSSVLGFNIHPHLLRHKWNERFSEKAQSKGFDREYTEDLRRNAMGWQPDSEMGRVYNDKHEQLIAIELMTEHQRKVDGPNK